MRTLFIGDVHGCSLELYKLLKQFKFQMGKDKLYLTGDVIDKGPNSIHVLEMIKDYNAKTVMGNHEEYFMEMYNAMDDDELFRKLIKKYTKIEPDNPLKCFLNRFGLKNLSQAKIIYNTVSKFPYYIDTPYGLLVHAGVNPKLSEPRKSHKGVLTHIRQTFYDGNPWYLNYKSKERIIFRHWAAPDVMQQNNAICLDTGCVYGYYLTGWCPEEDKIYQVKSNSHNKWPLKDRGFKDFSELKKDKKNINMAKELGLM